MDARTGRQRVRWKTEGAGAGGGEGRWKKKGRRRTEKVAERPTHNKRTLGSRSLTSVKDLNHACNARGLRRIAAVPAHKTSVRHSVLATAGGRMRENSAARVAGTGRQEEWRTR